jgi:hypothetical protein
VQRVYDKSRVWSVTFCRDFNDWEMDSVASFFLPFHSHAPNSKEADKLTWTLNRSGIFDTALIILRFVPLLLQPSLGRVFGGLKPLGGYLSLSGQQPGGES